MSLFFAYIICSSFVPLCSLFFKNTVGISNVRHQDVCAFMTSLCLSGGLSSLMSPSTLINVPSSQGTSLPSKGLIASHGLRCMERIGLLLYRGPSSVSLCVLCRMSHWTYCSCPEIMSHLLLRDLLHETTVYAYIYIYICHSMQKQLLLLLLLLPLYLKDSSNTARRWVCIQIKMSVHLVLNYLTWVKVKPS